MDEEKNRSNERKHGITFNEAIQVFLDPLQVSIQDRIEDGEERWQTLGVVRGVMLLLVAHTFQDDSEAESIVRIISARRANRRERRLYENENRSV